MYKGSKLGTFLNIILLVSAKRMDDGGFDISILILLQFYLRDLKQRRRKTRVTVSFNIKGGRIAINADTLD